MAASMDDAAIRTASQGDDRWNEGGPWRGLVAENGKLGPYTKLAFLPISIGSIKVGRQPLVDLYCETNGLYSLCCKAQSVFTWQARQRLVSQGVTGLLMCQATDDFQQIPLIATMLSLPDEEVPSIAKAGLLYQLTARLAKLPTARSEESHGLAEARLAAAMTAATLACDPAALEAIVRLMRHSPASYTHSVNTCIYAMLIGRELRLDASELRDLGCASLLHDIGSVRFTVGTSEKPSALSSEEQVAIRSHPKWSEALLAEARLSERALAGIRQHHERLDGSGYPLRLQDDEIGRIARIVALADTFDALTSPCPDYSPATPLDALLAIYPEVRDRFDPSIFSTFVNALEPCWSNAQECCGTFD